MDIEQVWLTIIGVILLGVVFALIWLILTIKNKKHHSLSEDLIKSTEADVERIFGNEFREELKNRGRLHFENILNENAMFLQQDLRLTTSQINEYMREQIQKILKAEFEHYSQSITAAKDQAIESIKKTQAAIEEQRKTLENQLKQQVALEKNELISKFEMQMAQIVSYYISEATSGELDLTSQLDFVLAHLEANKQSLIEDIRSGT